MKTQHTPGPWSRLDRPENSFDDSRILTHITNGAHIVCTLGTTRTDGSPNHSPNARLIAAAPDLLQVVEDYLLLCQLHDYVGAVPDAARSAIAKAKGEA
jgi:hypothetical protein